MSAAGAGKASQGCLKSGVFCDSDPARGSMFHHEERDPLLNSICVLSVTPRTPILWEFLGTWLATGSVVGDRIGVQ